MYVIAFREVKIYLQLSTRVTRKRRLLSLIIFVLFASLFSASPSNSAGVSISSQTQGKTPFIWNVNLSGVDLPSLQSVQFSIKPKAGSSTLPISATYSRTYLDSQNRINPATGQVTIAVFGLYASSETNMNDVTITLRGKQSSSTLKDLITTSPWQAAPYTSPSKVIPRNQVKLNFSFFYLREFAGDGFSPVLIDTDGEVRWIGTTGCNYLSPAVKFYKNAFYTNCGFQPDPLKATTLFRNNLDGSFGSIFDYAGAPVNATSIGHHNFDIGKQGLLLEIDANSNLEQEIIEVSPENGKVYKTFDFSKIISQAMIEGGDNPALFVRDPNVDWFHNNSAVYWPIQNELVVSSREHFVLAIDYATQKIKWIFGDPSKLWYKFASLRKYALKFAAGTIYPVGQHSLSISNNNQLLLFDNDLIGTGKDGTFNPAPPYSAPRMYSINERTGTAKETWQFLRAQPLWSPICSSIYQDGSSFLVDYSAQGSSDFGSQLGNNIGLGPEVMGLDEKKNVAFDFYYPGTVRNGWNADPIHLENLQFTASTPVMSSSTLLLP